MGEEHRLQIRGQMEQVPGACSWVVQVAEDEGLGMRDVNQVELAVDEAVTNIIEHGYHAGDASKHIVIAVKRQGHLFRVVISDEGPPFDPLQHTDPNPLATLDERADNGGGWGVFFIKKMMDEVSYRYAADRNHLILTKHV